MSAGRSDPVPTRLLPMRDAAAGRLYRNGFRAVRLVWTGRYCPACGFALGRFDGTQDGELWQAADCVRHVRTRANRRRALMCNQCGRMYVSPIETGQGYN
jgi:hypothetical protein|nr:MAG TPA: Protein of unknown function (DUF2089) [Caudoviricetes sp.]